MGSIKNVISESIEGHEEYHIMVSLQSALQVVKSIFLNFSSLYCIVLWHDDSPIFPGEREILHLSQACFAPRHKEGEILHVKRGCFALWLEEGGIFLFWRACFDLQLKRRGLLNFAAIFFSRMVVAKRMKFKKNVESTQSGKSRRIVKQIQNRKNRIVATE